MRSGVGDTGNVFQDGGNGSCGLSGMTSPAMIGGQTVATDQAANPITGSSKRGQQIGQRLPVERLDQMEIKAGGP
jgi:hypothetical protein